VDTGTGLDDVERRKPCPYQDSKYDASASQLVAGRYTDCGVIGTFMHNYVEFAKDNNLHSHHCESLKSHIMTVPYIKV
jgi:hypothetical protein